MPADRHVALDPLLAQASGLLLLHQNPSVAFLQRHLKIGFNRALGMMQSLEGVIVTAPDADGWRRMLLSGSRSSDDPLSRDYKLEEDSLS